MSSEFCCGLEEAAPIPPRAGQRGVLVGERCIVSEDMAVVTRANMAIRREAFLCRNMAAQHRDTAHAMLATARDLDARALRLEFTSGQCVEPADTTTTPTRAALGGTGCGL